MPQFILLLLPFCGLTRGPLCGGNTTLIGCLCFMIPWQSPPDRWNASDTDSGIVPLWGLLIELTKLIVCMICEQCWFLWFPVPHALSWPRLFIQCGWSTIVWWYAHYVCMSSFLHTGNGIVKVGQVMMVSINTLVVMYDSVFTGMHGCFCVHITMCLSVCVCLSAECVRIHTYVRTRARMQHVCTYVCTSALVISVAMLTQCLCHLVLIPCSKLAPYYSPKWVHLRLCCESGSVVVWVWSCGSMAWLAVVHWGCFLPVLYVLTSVCV